MHCLPSRETWPRIGDFAIKTLEVSVAGRTGAGVRGFCVLREEVGIRKRSNQSGALFLAYVAVYCGFVFLNAFAPGAMEWTPVFGVNLAVLYGLGLIAAAFGIACLYDWLCRNDSAGSQQNRAGEKPA